MSKLRVHRLQHNLDAEMYRVAREMLDDVTHQHQIVRELERESDRWTPAREVRVRIGVAVTDQRRKLARSVANLVTHVGSLVHESWQSTIPKLPRAE